MLFLAAALLILLFPDGRLPDRSFGAVPWVAVGGSVLATLRFATEPAGPFYFYTPIRNPVFEVGGALGVTVEVLGRLGLATLFVICVASMIAVFVRLGRAQGEERQQIKWFAYAATMLAGGSTVLHVISDVVDVWWLHWEVGFVATMVGLAGLPVALGIAILKYRLHDIDLIINLTVVYGLLTAVLAGIFEVTVVALQHLVLALTHVEHSQVAYFASALVMAALFEPLRRRIDAFVERRFFREST
jgi:hypothetical protein